MNFKFRVVETVREHYPKHLRPKDDAVAVIVPPETIAIATAIETELQRYADHMRDGLTKWQNRVQERLEEPEDGA